MIKLKSCSAASLSRLQSLIVALIFCFSAGFFLSAEELFWEYPLPVVKTEAGFSTMVSGGGLITAVWQESDYGSDNIGEVFLSVSTSRDGTVWNAHRKVIGPIPYFGIETQLYSVVVSDDGMIFIVVLGEDSLDLYRSIDEGGSFQLQSRIPLGKTVVSPRLFLNSRGDLVLYSQHMSVGEVTGVTSEMLTLYYNISTDGGISWSEAVPLVDDFSLKDNGLPFHGVYDGRDYLVFQVYQRSVGSNYQLYLMQSGDGGFSWDPAVRLTEFSESNLDFSMYDNQDASFAIDQAGLHLVWQRYRGDRPYPRIYYALFNLSGELINEPEAISPANRISRGPKIEILQGQPFLLWYDNRSGSNQIHLVQYLDGFWDDLSLSSGGTHEFAAFTSIGDELFVSWIKTLGSRQSLEVLRPDRSVPPPDITPVNFTDGRRLKQNSFQVRWLPEEDSSGIVGFSTVLSQDPDAVPPKPEYPELRINDRADSFVVSEDGMWYYHIIARDYAGNWSEPVSVSFFHDTTAPLPVQFDELDTDFQGFMRSNTTSVHWVPQEEDDDIAGYSYRVSYVGSPGYAGSVGRLKKPVAGNTINTSDTRFSFSNSDDGIWAITVKAIDTVGNIGEPTTQFYRLNKYVPRTYLTSVNTTIDDIGRIELTLNGRGFSVGGDIQQVILDTDGQLPYDYVFSPDLYNVASDRKVTSLLIDDIQEGRYRVGLIHPERGLYFSRTSLGLESTGTVKFGDFTVKPESRQEWLPRALYSLHFNTLIRITILILLGILFIAAVVKLSSIVKESRQLAKEARMIMQERLPVQVKKARLKQMQKRGFSLRIKFALLVTALVIIVIGLIAAPLFNYFIQEKQRVLGLGLEREIRGFIATIASYAEAPLKRSEELVMTTLHESRVNNPDILYVTLTGFQRNNPDSSTDYLWNSDDQDWRNKLVVTDDSLDIENLVFSAGNYVYSDELDEVIREMEQSINSEAAETIGSIQDSLQELKEDQDSLGRKKFTVGLTDDEEEQLKAFEDTIRRLNQSLGEELKPFRDRFVSEPEFDIDNLSSETPFFTFYKPIIFEREQDRKYYRGTVRIKVSIERILSEIQTSQQEILRIVILYAIIAMAVGIAGSLLLAYLIIRPIKTLLTGVEIIRDTEDKEELKTHTIRINTNDEIAALANTVNQMTQGLVKAATASKDLSLGKDVQKMFIPLEKNAEGRKLTTGRDDGPYATFFGYYEGAWGVSGDFFDFQKLDEEHYAVIKCDVAGKGVPASLIMVEVATIFIDHFKGWAQKPNENAKVTLARRKQLMKIEELVARINELLEERGFKGRFAALNLILMNVRTGQCHMCNAGDKLVPWYNNGKGKVEILELNEIPAAGIFANDMLEFRGGYQALPHKLNKGDTLFLWTDGIDEAQRKLRDSSFELMKKTNFEIEDEMIRLGLMEEADRENREGKDPEHIGFEELGMNRIKPIVESIYKKGAYELKRLFDPTPENRLFFDFSSCTGDIQETILGVISVEKMFRVFKPETATENDKIKIDRKVDEFLRGHFKAYDDFFHTPIDSLSDSEYIYYGYLKEDDQFDDLTVMGVRRK